MQDCRTLYIKVRLSKTRSLGTYVMHLILNDIVCTSDITRRLTYLMRNSFHQITKFYYYFINLMLKFYVQTLRKLSLDKNVHFHLLLKVQMTHQLISGERNISYLFLQKIRQNKKQRQINLFAKLLMSTMTISHTLSTIVYFFLKSRDNITPPLDCPSSKGNHAPTQKFKRPNGKNTKSKIFLKSVQNLCPLSHLKALCSEFFEELNRIKTNQNK